MPITVQEYIKTWADARKTLSMERFKADLKTLKIPEDIPHDKGKSMLGRVAYAKETVNNDDIKNSLSQFNSSSDVSGKNLNALLSCIETHGLDTETTESCVALYILLNKMNADLSKSSATFAGRQVLKSAGIDGNTGPRIARLLNYIERVVNEKQAFEQSKVIKKEEETAAPNPQAPTDSPTKLLENAKKHVRELEQSISLQEIKIETLKTALRKSKAQEALLAKIPITFFQKISDFFTRYRNKSRVSKGEKTIPLYADREHLQMQKGKGEELKQSLTDEISLMEGKKKALDEARFEISKLEAKSSAQSTTIEKDNKWHRPAFIKAASQALGSLKKPTAQADDKKINPSENNSMKQKRL
jgi:hypothetical protein